MAISKSGIGQHKRMAMGDLSVGFKKGGHIKPVEKKMGGKCYAEGGSVAETYNGGTGIKRDDMTGKRIKEKDGEASLYKKGGRVSGKKK